MSTHEEALFPSEALPTSTSTDASQVTALKAEEAFGDRVNAIVAKMTQGEDGIWKLPDSIEADETIRYAATVEKRRRDTESQLGKTKHALKAKESEAAELQTKLQQYMADNLTSRQRADLEELKYTNPDQWREQLAGVEKAAQAKVKEELGTISQKASQHAELERRSQILAEHNNSNPQYAITDEVLANDIPPRIARRLERGEVTFEEFLAEASDYLKAGKVFGSPNKIDPQPNLGNAGGGSKPTNTSASPDFEASYKAQIF